MDTDERLSEAGTETWAAGCDGFCRPAIARAKGFTDVRTIEAWDSTAVGDLTVTAAPGEHGVHEVTFVIQAGGRTVFSAATHYACPS
jgi:hypothetical protein